MLFTCIYQPFRDYQNTGHGIDFQPKKLFPCQTCKNDMNGKGRNQELYIK